MRRIAARRWAFLFCLLSCSSSFAQNIINTIVGGGSPLNGTNPLAAALSTPAGVIKDANGNTYVSSGDGEYVFKIDTKNQISILAGAGYSGYGISGTSAPATTATITSPFGLALDNTGSNLFIADGIAGHHVFEVNLATGILTNFAGSASASNPPSGFGLYGGDGGPATQALLNAPTGVAVFNGTVYIADSGNNRIRAVAPDGTISTYAGNGNACAAPPACGDGGLATSANLTFPVGVAVDSTGNVYIADSFDQEIREVDAATGHIFTVAGNGSACNPPGSLCGDNGPATSANLNRPGAVFVDGAGNIYIADTFDAKIRIVNIDGFISTVVGDGQFGFSPDGTPAVSASLDSPEDVFVDAQGNIFFAEGGSSLIREVPLASQTLLTIAGGSNGGDGGQAANAVFSVPYGIAIDSANDLFISDFGTSRIREVAAGSQIVSTVAGTGTTGFSGDGGPATSATLNLPEGVSVDRTNGNIFIADTFTDVVRTVQGGTINTIAGIPFSPCSPSTGGCGDGGPAASASLNMPADVALGANGSIVIADTNDNRIRSVDNSANHIITTVAGTGSPCLSSTGACGDGGPATSANLTTPAGLAVDSSGNIFIADSGDNRVRRVDATTGVITTVAFNGQATFAGDGGPATLASMVGPARIAIDAAGNLFITGTDTVVRRVDAATQTVATVAGNPAQPLVFGFFGDGGPATSATMFPFGVAINATKGLYIADAGNNRIRLVQLSPAAMASVSSVDFGNQTVNVKSSPIPITITNSGGDDLLIASIVDANGFAQTNNCPIAPNPLAPAQTCTINVTFTPSGTGTANDTLTITDNAAGSPQRIQLTGIGQPGLTLSPSPISFSQLVGTTSAAQAVTLTAAGSTAVTISAVALTGPNASEFAQTNNCITTLEPGQSCTVNVTFTPNAAGTPTASLTVTDSAAGSPQILPITGKVQNFSLTTTCTSLTVVPGQTAIYTVDLAPVNGFAQPVTLACSGAPASATCTVNPGSITMDGSTTVKTKVTATTTPPTSGFLQTPFDRSDANRLAGLIGLAGMTGLAALVILPRKPRTKQARRLFVGILCLCLLSSVATLSSCGVGGGKASPDATSAGTYPLKVTATFKSSSGTTFSEQVSFNLVVQ